MVEWNCEIVGVCRSYELWHYSMKDYNNPNAISIHCIVVYMYTRIECSVILELK